MTMWDPTGSWCHAIHSKFLTAIHGAGWDPILSRRILQDPINIRSCVRCLPWIDVLTLVKSVDEIVRYDLLNKSCRVALSCCAVLFLRSFAKWYLGSFLLFWPWEQRLKCGRFSTGQYRKAYSGCREHFEDLQQDLAVIGQIAGLVATLRRSYQVTSFLKHLHTQQLQDIQDMLTVGAARTFCFADLHPMNLYCHLSSSVCRAPVCRSGGRRFESQPDQHPECF